MNLRQAPILLIAVMTASVIGVTFLTIWLLYSAAVNQQTNRLVEVAQSRARLIETMMEHAVQLNKTKNQKKAESMVLEQIVNAHAKFIGFGNTGEFTLGKIAGDKIEFLLSHRHADIDSPKPIALNSNLAEPMRRALAKKSGTLVGLDYRGVTVLAAHEPVNGVNWGIVAKIDFNEIREPFIKAGVYAAIGAAVLIFFGSALFLRITQPLIQKIRTSEQLYRERFDSSEKKFKTLFSASKDAMVVYSDDEIIDCNSASLSMFACQTREDLIGKHPSELSPARQSGGQDSMMLANEKIETAFKKGSNYFEWQHRRASGEIFPAEVLLTAVDLGDRSVIQATIRDITHRKQIEADLERQRVLFKAVFEDVPDVMVIANLNREIFMSNRALKQTFGYEKSEVMNKTTECLYESIEEYERQGRERFNLTAEQKLKPYVVSYRRKNGEIFPGETIGTAIRDEAGETIAYIGVIRDISERVKAEAELNRQKTELEISNKELESYSYSIAHDLRAPLRAIVSFSQLLNEDVKDKLNSEELGYLTRIVGAGKNMAQLIDDILELSRISRSQIEFAPVNLSQIADALKSQIEQSDATRQVNWHIEKDLIVQGDTTLLTVALQNLLENAWKFTRDNKEAKIGFGKLIQNDECIYYVKDNGIGFDMEHADKLFKPFHRLHTKDFEGTGIGLATVYRIIQRHHGRVWVEAFPEQGATFYFTLNPFAH